MASQLITKCIILTIHICFMKSLKFLVFFLFSFFSITAQVIPQDTTKIDFELEENYILNDTIQLPELLVMREKMDTEARKKFLILQNRVYVTYPYAKLASERLVNLNKGMANLKTNREKKKYFNIIENYLNNEFEAKLKKLSRSQGRILVKLIHRQTGTTTFVLVKTLKSGWKAFWSNTAASMFDINLKTKYSPYEVNEDYLIETILVRAFQSGRLQNQNPAKPIDYDNLTNSWESRVENSNE